MPWTDGVVTRVLANGLTLLAQRAAAAPVVAVVTHVRAGYFDEPDEWVGIAHVLEHMYFKGTARRGPGDVARETKLVGGYISAGTIYDKTVYYTVLPSAGDGVTRALDIQADALMHAALDPGELRRELEVIIQEAKRKLDTPSAVATEALYALLFRVHRMRRWRIGSPEGLRRLTRDDVLAYHTTRYVPQRVIVGIMGDVDPEAALDAAEALYGAWQMPAGPVDGSPPEPEGVEPRLRAMYGDVERPLAELGWRTVGALHPDAPALDVAATVIGEGRGARLYRALQRPGIAAASGAYHYSPTEVGLFELGVESEPDRVNEAIRGALDAVRQLAKGGPTDDEMARAHALLEAQWAKRFEGAEGRASALCTAEALGGVELADLVWERERAVTAEDVRRVAQRYLPADGVCGVLYLPSGVEAPSGEAWPPVLDAGRKGWSGGLPLLASTAKAARAPGDRVRIGALEHLALDGADLLLQPTPGTGLVTLLVHFLGVPGGETEETAGLSWLLARSALRGTEGMDGDQLAQAAERLGGGIVPSVGVESLGWGMTVRASALGDAAELLRRVAAEPTLDAREVEVERGLQASDARRARDDMFRHPLQEVLGEAFPGDPYGLRRLGEPEGVMALSASQVQALAEGLRARRATLVAVGDLEAARAVEALAPLLAWSAVGSDDGGVSEPVWRAGRGAERRRREQTALAMAFPAAPFGSPDRYPIAVMASLLSGLAGRLFDELRDKRSLAYTVAALPWLARRAGALLCYIATSPEREDEARSAMLEELRRVVLDPPDAEELAGARNYAAGSVEIRRQTGRAVAGEILQAWGHGALETLPETAERLRAVSVEEIVRVAEGIVREEVRAEYVVRGGDT